MEVDASQSSRPIPPTPRPSTIEIPGAGRRRRRRRRAADRTPPAHATCDTATEAILLTLVIFTPWALGTTQSWSIWTANLLCYALGLLLAAKWVIRWREEYRPARWGEVLVVTEASGDLSPPRRRVDPATGGLAILTVLLLGYILISALNARADYNARTRAFEYFEGTWRWLPFTYDRSSTWFVFWQYLGLACAFWSVRDWLLHRSRQDLKDDDTPRWSDPGAKLVIPARLGRLLWVLCLNATLLAVVSIIQRAEGTSRLLWLVESRSGKQADTVFGPWSYRSNGAQYFNLVWPVCLAFWLWLQERAGRALTGRLSRFDGPQLILLPCAIFVAACPMISASRGGAMVSVLGGGLATLMVYFMSRRDIARSARRLTAGALVVAGLVAAVFGWPTIRERLAQPDTRFATGIDVRTNDFTVLLRVRVPEEPKAGWQSLVGFASNGRLATQPGSFQLAWVSQGAFLVQAIGSTLTNYQRFFATNLVVAQAGREVQLAVVRQGNVRVFVDGQEVGGMEVQAGRAPGWNGFLQTRYLFVSDASVGGVALVNFAMTPEEIARSAAQPLGQLEDELLKAVPVNEVAGATASFTLPERVTAEVSTRPTDPATPWWVLRRRSGSGPLGMTQTLKDLDPRLRGPLRVGFRAWNPANDPIHLGVRLDGGPVSFAVVDPRSEAGLDLVCRAPHGQPPSQVEVFLVDEEGNPIEEAPAGTQLYFRELNLHAGGSVFAQELVRKVRLLEFTDRMSGRNEIYGNAMRMAQDYPVWGSGAGTFATVYQLYMQPGQDWAAYLHNDWLELRITFGWVGFTLIVAALAVLLYRSWLGGGLSALRVVIALWWLALAGCLAHARFDFPFQVYSVLFLFLLLCAILSVLTAARPR